MALTRRLGQAAYGAVFTLLLPALLVTWAWRLDHSGMAFWPLPLLPWVGVASAIIGLLLMAASMRVLWNKGHGLPMNAFPPTRFVMSATYAVLSHPIYAGFVLIVGGISIAMNSPSGFWVVTPVAALAAVALVAGYEGPRLRARFGDADSWTPMFAIPAARPSKATLGRKISATLLALTPWAAMYSLLSMMPEPQGAVDLRMAWETAIPTAAWTMWIYSAAYPAVIIAPLLLRTDIELRRFVIAAWLATLIGFGVMLVFPCRAAFLPLSYDGLNAWLANANRTLDAEWLALPSFHVLWIVFAFYCFTTRFSRLAPLWFGLAAIVCASCLTTGSHAVLDVASGVGLGLLCWHREKCWQSLVRAAEKLGNSWNAIQVGPVRIINHAVWSAAAATVGLLVVYRVAGSNVIAEVAMVFGSGLIAAGAWGYWLEGGGRLSRPFGYYGFLFGAMGMLAVLAVTDADASPRLVAAFAIGAPLAQAIGRLRCLVQGCCHGKPVVSASGIRVVHPNSRVAALSHLHGIPVHPTQLYSIAGNLLIFAVLWRFWELGATSSFLGGMYLILSSLARFVEEQYRGEPQTLKKYGLAIYQWLAVALFVTGILFSMTSGAHLAPAFSITMDGAVISLAAGVVAGVFMSVDLPYSRRRFSRLTVSPKP